jgi:hypothetical protein
MLLQQTYGLQVVDNKGFKGSNHPTNEHGSLTASARPRYGAGRLLGCGHARTEDVKSQGLALSANARREKSIDFMHSVTAFALPRAICKFKQTAESSSPKRHGMGSSNPMDGA